MASVQKKLAAKVLKTGISKVWLNPEKMKDIEKAITKWDIRKLIKKGEIKALPEKIKVRGKVKKRRRGPGSRKGKKYSIISRKRRWISIVRPQRKMLRELKATGQLDNANYRKLYKLVKGGMFRSRAHLKLYIEQNNMLKK
ncbi:MAG: 50S ribosomal protein L19e [Candidatus Aenigmatarchaeota archaeon]|nr:50S ribosomal protein L19e [Candidatus Aenigmarchaeota archaeon]